MLRASIGTQREANAQATRTSAPAINCIYVAVFHSLLWLLAVVMPCEFVHSTLSVVLRRD